MESFDGNMALTFILLDRHPLGCPQPPFPSPFCMKRQRIDATSHHSVNYFSSLFFDSPEENWYFKWGNDVMPLFFVCHFEMGG